jgi:hypothetical protein
MDCWLLAVALAGDLFLLPQNLNFILAQQSVHGALQSAWPH